MGEDAHPVAHVLQLPQVVGGDQHGGALLGHVGHDEAPHLPAHHRVQAVHRLVQHQHLRPAAQGEPEGGLLLHTLGKAAHGPLLIHLGKEVPQGLVAVLVEPWIKALQKPGHVPGGGRQEIVELVGDGGDPGLGRRILIDGLPLQQHLPGILPVDAGNVAEKGGFARSVGAHQAVHRPLGHRHGQSVQRPEAVKGLDHIPCLDHIALSPFVPASLTRWASSLGVIPRNSSSVTASSSCLSRASRRPSAPPAPLEAKTPRPASARR